MIKLGLVGHNINHSLSGKIHEFALDSFGVKGAYTVFNLEAEELAPFLNRAWEEGAHGFNITSPHKKTVAQIVANKTLSAVNTLYRGKKGWDSCSTDGAGFSRGLQKMNREPRDFSRVVILGNGGVLPAILGEFPEAEVSILRRNERGDIGLKELRPRLNFHPWSPSALEALLEGASSETLLIQASSAPLRGDSLQEFAGALRGFGGSFVDLVYGTPSQLFFKAKEMKLPCQDGLPMLIEQARIGQEIWFGRSVGFDSLMELLAEHRS